MLINLMSYTWWT